MAVEREQKKGLRFNEVMVLIGALGILVSVAVPSYLRLENSERIDTLLSSARNLREDLSRLISHSEPVLLPDSESVPIPSSTLETFLRLYNMTGQKPPAERTGIVMEPAGLTRDRCARDGKIHVIPMEDVVGVVAGATILVTNKVRQGDPANDGLLAVYKIRTDMSETQTKK